MVLHARRPRDIGMERHPCQFLAPGAEEGMEADDLLCSRNARPMQALIGRAQWKINHPHP